MGFDGFRKKAKAMVINNIQYSMKPSIVALLAPLSAPVQLLAKIKLPSLTASLGIATALNRSRSLWQRRDAVIAIPWKEPQACS